MRVPTEPETESYMVFRDKLNVQVLSTARLSKDNRCAAASAARACASHSDETNTRVHDLLSLMAILLYNSEPHPVQKKESHPISLICLYLGDKFTHSSVADLV